MLYRNMKKPVLIILSYVLLVSGLVVFSACSLPKNFKVAEKPLKNVEVKNEQVATSTVAVSANATSSNVFVNAEYGIKIVLPPGAVAFESQDPDNNVWKIEKYITASDLCNRGEKEFCEGPYSRVTGVYIDYSMIIGFGKATSVIAIYNKINDLAKSDVNNDCPDERPIMEKINGYNVVGNCSDGLGRRWMVVEGTRYNYSFNTIEKDYNNLRKVIEGIELLK